MVRTTAKVDTKATYPKTEFNAYEAKAREIHGESAAKYGIQSTKRDGALMSSAADWKNT